MRMLKWLSSSENIWEQIEKLNFEWHVQLILRANSSILNSLLKNEVPLKSNITTPNVSTNCVHVHQHISFNISFVNCSIVLLAENRHYQIFAQPFLLVLAEKVTLRQYDGWHFVRCPFFTIGKSPFDIEIFIVCWK